MSALSDSFSGFPGFLKPIQSLAGSIADLGLNLGASALKNSISLEDAMNGVKRTANLSSDALQDLTEQVREYAVDALKGFGTSEQLAQALEQAGQQGVFAGKTLQQGSADALAFAGTMVKAAVALDGLNLKTASERLGLFHGTFTSVIPTIENAASVLNYFGNTTKRGADFILNLSGRMAETANFVGLTEQSTLALAATLGNLNQVASRSGTAMSRILRLMMTDTADFAAAFQLNASEFQQLVREDMEGALVMLATHLQSLGKEDTLAGLKQMGLTGDGVATTMLGLGNLVTQLSENFAAAGEEWEKNTSLMDEFISSSERFSSLWGALREIFGNIAGLFGDAVLPHLKNLVQLINQAAGDLFRWAKSSEFLTETLPRVLSDLNLKMRTTIDRAVEFIKTFDWEAFFQQSIEQAGAFFGTVVDFMNTILGMAKGVHDVIQGWREFNQSIEDSLMPLANMITYVERIDTKLGVSTSATSAWTRAWDALADLMLTSLPHLRRGWDALWDVLANALLDSVPHFRRAWEGLKSYFQDWVTGIDLLFTDMGNDFLMNWDLIFEGIAEGLQSIQDLIVTVFQEMGRQIKDVAALGVKPFQDAIDLAAKAIEKLGIISHEQSVWPEMVGWIHSADASVQEFNTSLSQANRAMASVSEGLAKVGFGGMDSDTLRSLSRTTGVFNAQGLIGLQKLARQNQVSVAQQSQTASPSAFAATTQAVLPTHITLNVDGEALTGIITTKQREQASRVTSGFGTSTGGFATGGTGF